MGTGPAEMPWCPVPIVPAALAPMWLANHSADADDPADGPTWIEACPYIKYDTWSLEADMFSDQYDTIDYAAEMHSGKCLAGHQNLRWKSSLTSGAVMCQPHYVLSSNVIVCHVLHQQSAS